MNIKELANFKLSDAISFHDELNPKLWRGNKLIPVVKEQLETIAQDFLEELGINDLDVRDITISGSNAAYTYTPHSDLDLHILVNMADLPQSEVYKELFNAKKTIYNDSHDITVHGVPVELYVQDSNEPVKSLGEYSIKDDKWLRIPTKRRANFDQSATKLKYEKMLELVNAALKTKNNNKLNKILKKIKQYRQAGLDKYGEFGPENLAFKMLRSQGHITKLYQLRDKLHSEKLSIEGMYSETKTLDKPTPTISDLVKKHSVSREQILDQLLKGIQVELEHTSDEIKAREIALDHLGEDPEYYTKLANVGLEEGFDQPYPFKWEKSDYGDYDALATLPDGSPLNIMFNQEEDDNGPAYHVEFYRNDSQEVTGEGDAQRVFATVLTAIKQFVKKVKPQKIVFSAVKDQDPKGSRSKLYDRLVDRYATQLGYDVDISSSSDKVNYELFKQIRVTESASGYIPSNAEKDDPRFKTALTVDIKPDTLKKNAQKLGSKISRAGIPPTLRADGKF